MASPRLFYKENGGGEDNPKIEKTTEGMPFGSVKRTRLADISNLPHQSKPLGQEVNPRYTKEYIDELLKENMALKKLLVNRNKIIELRELELQKLRINLQKVQLQNLQLTQANSQMLAELDSDKDGLKTLQHELACINGLLKARNVEMGEKEKKKTCQNTANEEGMIKSEKPEEISQVDGDDNKPCCTSRRQQYKDQSALGPSTTKQVQAKEKADDKRHSSRTQSSRFKSREPECTEELSETDDGNQVQAIEKADKKRHSSRRQSARFKSRQPEGNEELFQTDDAKQVLVKEKADNKRQCSRRQSAIFKSREPECTEDLFETDDGKFPVSTLHKDQMLGRGLASSNSLVKEDKEGNIASSYETQEFQRSSIGRPLRRAAERVQSYKEIPLNLKMRRSE